MRTYDVQGQERRAHLAVPILASQHERRVPRIHLRLKICASLEQVEGDLLVI